MALQEFHEKRNYVIESYYREMGHQSYIDKIAIPEQTLTNYLFALSIAKVVRQNSLKLE